MKKTLFGACAIMALIASSCGNCCGDAKCGTANDSLSVAYGDYVGSMLHSDFNQFSEGADSDAKKADFLKGLQMIFSNEGTRESHMGMQVALQMLNEIQQLNEQGVEMNNDAILKSFKKAFLADSLSFADIQLKVGAFRELYQAELAKAQAAKEAEEAAELAEDPVVVQNGKIAESFIADQKAANENVKSTDSGLAYLILEPGDDNKPGENATVTVHYTGKHINGEVFDSSVERGEPAEFNLQGVVAGFREGLMLLGKGGKATLYIPGELGYGLKGQPAAGIAPNELLIFDVELLDIAQ